MSATIRVLIVDDEPLSRERIARLLGRRPDVEVVGECADGVEALGAIDSLTPDLVFLDVRMPELDGLGVVEALDQALGPHIVFVTAHDQYMERAFAVHALDYLRKPFTDTRFFDALEHARLRIDERRGYDASRAGVLSLLAGIRASAGAAPERLALREHETGRFRLIRPRQIEWIEAHEKRVRVHLISNDEPLPWQVSLREAARALAAAGFLRVHRRFVVNGARISGFEPLWKGEYVIVLESGKSISTGRAYRAGVEAFLTRA